MLFVPQGVFSTEAARSMLPDKVDRNDAIFNIARVASLTQAMCTSLFGSISTILTILSWICAGVYMCGALPSPVCA